MYAQDHDGKLPPNLSALIPIYISTPTLFKRPWVGFDAKPPPGQDLDEWFDYIYIPWPSTTGDYENYPLMYDRYLANHSGKGINILIVDVVNRYAGIKGPKFWFWDEGAQWLQKFAKEHPEYNIPLPEGVR